MEYCGRLIDVIDEPKCVGVLWGDGKLAENVLLRGCSFIAQETQEFCEVSTLSQMFLLKFLKGKVL